MGETALVWSVNSYLRGGLVSMVWGPFVCCLCPDYTPPVGPVHPSRHLTFVQVPGFAYGNIGQRIVTYGNVWSRMVMTIRTLVS